MGVMRTSEGEKGQRHGDGYVDADHPDVDFVLVLAGSGAVAGENCGAVAVLVAVNNVNRVVKIRCLCELCVGKH